MDTLDIGASLQLQGTVPLPGIMCLYLDMDDPVICSGERQGLESSFARTARHYGMKNVNKNKDVSCRYGCRLK